MMDSQDGGTLGGSLNLSSDQNGDNLSAEAMSPDSGSNSNAKSKLQLPMSCDPPGPSNPVKQLVWIVRTSRSFLSLLSLLAFSCFISACFEDIS
jgi:hypothetical protein